MYIVDMSDSYYWSLMPDIKSKILEYKKLKSKGDNKAAGKIIVKTKTLPEFYKLYGQLSIWCSCETKGFYQIDGCRVFHFELEQDAQAFKDKWL